MEVIGTPANNYFSGSSGLRSNTTGGSSNAGNVTVKTKRLTVRDQGNVGVSNEGLGDAGNLVVEASSIRLDHSASLSSEVQAGSQGNITLNANNIQLRRGSNITTNASNTATGGNITIDTGTLVALENSNITANAFQGRGGNILISAQGIFPSADSDITAASELGINGVVEVRNLSLDQQNALVAPESNLVSTEQIVAGSCLARGSGKEGVFVVTGNGGLPENPYGVAPLPYELVQVQPVKSQNLSDASWQFHYSVLPTHSDWQLGDPIQPAGELLITADGRTLLVAASSQAITNPQDLTCDSAALPAERDSAALPAERDRE